MSPHPAWLLIGLGVVLIVIGLVWLTPAGAWLGRLPGDIAIERGNVRFYFPLVTCLLLSALLTAAVWLVRYFTK